MAEPSAPLLGRWWLPGCPGETLGGVLTGDHQLGEASLLLDGHFSTQVPRTGEASPMNWAHVPIPVLNGQFADGRWVTLFDCYQQGSGIPEVLKTSQRVYPRIVVIGAHFPSRSAFRLRSLSGRYSQLDSWAEVSFSTVRFSETVYPVSVEYSKPASVTVDLESGHSISLGHEIIGPNVGDPVRVEVRRLAWLTARSTGEDDYQKLQDLQTKAAELISLCAGQSAHPLELRGCQPDGKRLSISVNAALVAPPRKDVRRDKMIVTLDLLADQFGSIMKNWISTRERLRPLIVLYFGTQRNPSTYLEHRFLSLFQALESFHRRNGQPPDAQEIRDRKKRILSSIVEGEDKAWLEDCFRKIPDLPARERLMAVVQSFDASWLFEDVSRDIKEATQIRNYLTHYDRNGEQRLPPGSDSWLRMIRLSARMQVLCEVILLVEAAGLDRSFVKQRLLETRRLEGILPTSLHG